MKTRHKRGKEPDGERGESMERHVVGSPEIWSGVGEMKHGVPNAGPRVKFMSRTDHALRWRTRSLTGLATRRDDVVRAQTAWAVKEPDTTKIAPEHPKVLISDHGHVELEQPFIPAVAPMATIRQLERNAARVIISISPRESVGDRNPVLEETILTAARRGVKRSGETCGRRSSSVSSVFLSEDQTGGRVQPRCRATPAGPCRNSVSRTIANPTGSCVLRR